MKYLSVCSGIEAASAAWEPLGWTPLAFSEIDAFPSAVLAHHYPQTPNWGDMTRFQEWPDATTDVLVGGTPCQSFSFAGLRKGLADPRGNLMLTYLAIAARYRPEWLVWENVPGVLSSAEGRDFAALLRGLGLIGYGFAYRILDAQYFGVAQRRRRVFLVGNARGWQRAAAVLFERASLSWNSAPSRETRKDIAPTVRAGAENGGRGHGARSGDSKDELITHSLSAEGHDASEDGTGRGVPLICSSSGQANAEIDEDRAQTLNCLHEAPIVAFNTTQLSHPDNRSNPQPGDPCHTLSSHDHPPAIMSIRTAQTGANGHGIADEVAHTLDESQGQAVAFHNRQDPDSNPYTHPLGAQDNGMGILQRQSVRRLTPTECERLQGFPDGYTAVPYRGRPAKDGPRYKALGNSMAVPVMHWIGQRIQMVAGLQGEQHS